MVKSTSSFICQQCGYVAPSFLGKCPECGTWNSLVEEVISDRRYGISKKTRGQAELVKLSDIESNALDRLSSNIGEVDRVLGGGIVKGSVILLAGEPGIGKSTLLTQIALVFAGPTENIASQPRSLVRQRKRPAVEATSDTLSGEAPDHLGLTAFGGSFAHSNLNSTLYVAGEESPTQIKLRAERIKKGADILILNETSTEVIGKVLEEVKPALVIIDSIQTMELDNLDSPAGSISQVRESAYYLGKLAKKFHISIILVGHITKEGAIAGPKVLEHSVDVVLSLEGEASSPYRILRASKNRFGSVDEIGVFDMKESGLEQVSNPSKVFLNQKSNAPGSVVTSLLNGSRPVLVEIQALVTKTILPYPRRVANGIDFQRLQLLAAVISKRLNLNLFDKDIFVNVTGGIKISDTACDLAVCLAIISSIKDKPVSTKTVVFGEVGLLGELRTIQGIEKRAQEAKRLGFTKIISPDNAKNILEAMKKVLV